MTLGKIRRLTFFIFLLLSAGFIGYRLGARNIPSPVNGADLSVFWEVWHRLQAKYLDQSALDPRKMMEGAIAGMVSSLGDPYTVFLPTDDNQLNKEDLTGEFGGIGIQLGYNKDNILAVVAPLSGTPAEKIGVKAGDLIMKIKDKEKGVDRDTNDVSLPEAIKLIRGKEGSVVSLTLMRDGLSKSFEVAIKREKIVVPAIVWHVLEENGKKFAYIHVLQFSERMDREWVAMVSQLAKEKEAVNFGGVILDLRNNPGGYLQGAVFLAGEFLPEGSVVVWQEDYLGEKTKLIVNRKGQLLTVPLTILVNEGSASAAEILAGALRDNHRAKIVGSKTFGKGTVQEPEELTGKAGLHITIARWLLPSGESIHKSGIKPDFEIKEATEEAKKEDPILNAGISVLSQVDRGN